MTHFPLRQSDFGLYLLLIILLAGGLRLYRLAQYPQIFDQDEAVLGYDAWSLWLTGRDHHGQVLPIYFRTFGDYVPPAANYLAAPFVGLLGPDEFSARLPFALMGTATVLLTALTGKRWFRPTAGLIAGLFLAIEPWHINYSRTAFPASCMPFFTILGLYTFTRAVDLFQDFTPAKRLPLLAWLTTSGAALGLLTDCYPGMKIQGPLLVLTCIIGAAPILWKYRWYTAYWLFAYLFVVNPLFVLQILEWNQIQQRFNAVSGFGRPNWLLQAARLYAEHYNPVNLFFTGFSGGISVRPPGVGELFWLEGPLWIAAAIGLARREFPRRAGFSLILLLALWFITFPIADSLTEGDQATATTLGHAHEIRAYNFVPLPELLAGYGAVILWRKLARFRIGRLPANVLAAIAGCIVLTAFVIYFLSDFFGPPLIDVSVPVTELGYAIGLRPMLDRVKQEATACDTVWLPETNETYMYYLFFSKVPPAQFQQFAVQHFGYDVIYLRDISQVHFGQPDFSAPNQNPQPECTGKPGRTFYLGRYPKPIPNWRLVAATRNKDDVVVWGLFESPRPAELM